MLVVAWRCGRAIRRAASIAGLLALLLAAGTPLAHAQAVFVVADVPVDVTATDANQARDQALNAGMRDALVRLLRRMAPQETYSRLPQPNPRDLSALVYGIEVKNERTSPTRYLATVTVSFKKDAIRALLQRTGIPFAETASRPVLILPVYAAAGATLLWDDPNPWRQAWGALGVRDSLSPMVLPRGDLADIATLGAAQAAAGDRARLNAIAGRYGVEDVLVAQATLRNEIGSRIPSIDVVLRRLGPSGEGTSIESYRGEPQESLQQLMTRAVAAIASGIEERWKRDTLLAFGNENRLSATVTLTTLQDLVAVRQRLEAAPEIRAIELSEVSGTSAQVMVRYFGDPSRLALALAQSGLVLSQNGGFWTLALRLGAPPRAAE